MRNAEFVFSDNIRMKMSYLSAAIVILVLHSCHPDMQQSDQKVNNTSPINNYDRKSREDSLRREWFRQAHFGMFIHMGAYSVAARGEWVMNRELIPYEEYKIKYAKKFTAENYDPEKWAEIAKNAGMKYIVFGTRHHDGFCLWDTKTKEFNSMNYGPNKDLVRLFVNATRKAGLKVGFYYSAADWTHPDYPSFERDWPTTWKSEEARKRFVEFYQSQVRELMTNYGKIDILWWDGTAPEEGLEGEAINKEIYQLQPGILINNRNGEPCDFGTPENVIKEGGKGKPWEVCLTMNDHWGYHATDHNYKSSKQIVQSLVKCISLGGNLLLNVGPKPDGTFPEESVMILGEVGNWLKKNHEFMDGHTGRSDFTDLWNNSLIPTVNGNKLYLHFNYPPSDREFCYAEIKNDVNSVKFLETGKNIEFSKTGPRLFLLNLPRFDKDKITTVVIEVKGKLEVAQIRTD